VKIAEEPMGSAKILGTSFLFVVYYLEWNSGQICPLAKRKFNRKGILFLEE